MSEFRAWDKKLKKMFPVVAMEWSSSGYIDTVKVDDRGLINAFEFEIMEDTPFATKDKNGKLKKSSYGNNHEITHDFDEQERKISDNYNSVTTYTYEYDGNGNLARHKDLENNVTYRYLYDFIDRLRKVTDTKGNTIEYSINLKI